MTERNLTGLFFRTRDKDHKPITKCFEELSKEQREAIIFLEDDKFKLRLIERLVDTINEIGELTDLIRGNEDEE